MSKTNRKAASGASARLSINPTKNDLESDVRRQVVEMLSARVADAIDLTYQVRTAHFNVKGPSFGALHELFDKIYEFTDEAVDIMAERAVQLGGQMRTTIRNAAAMSKLDEYPTDLKAGLDHCEAVSDRLAAFGKLIRDDVEKAEDAGDKDTSDMLIDISREIDKFLWMVEAHIQTDR